MSDFQPTHTVPVAGMASWPEPNPAAPNGPPIGGGLEVDLAERLGDWARVVFVNGWSGWVDARLLVPIPVAPLPAAAPGPPSGPPTAAMATVAAPIATATAPIATSAAGPIAPSPTSATSPAKARSLNLASLTGGDRGKSFVLIGAVIAGVSAFLPWVRGRSSANAFDVPIKFLVDNESLSNSGPGAGLFIVALAIGIVVAMVKSADARLARVLAFALAAIPLGYAFQLRRLLADSSISFSELVGIGVPATIVGAAMAAFGPMLGHRTTKR